MLGRWLLDVSFQVVLFQIAVLSEAGPAIFYVFDAPGASILAKGAILARYLAWVPGSCFY